MAEGAAPSHGPAGRTARERAGRSVPGTPGPRRAARPQRTSGKRRHLRPGLTAAAAASPHVGGFPRMHLPSPLRPAVSPRLPSAPSARSSRAGRGLRSHRSLLKGQPGWGKARGLPGPAGSGPGWAPASRNPRTADFPPSAAPRGAVHARRTPRGKGPCRPFLPLEKGGEIERKPSVGCCEGGGLSTLCMEFVT